MPRLIHALQFELKPLVDDGRSCSLIVWLDRNGQSRNVINQPGSAKRRIVDLRNGDTIYHNRQPRTVIGIKTFRESEVADDRAWEVAEGWLLKV